MTFQELIDRAISLATRATDPSVAPALAAEMVAEDIVTKVFHSVSTRMAANPSTRHLVRRTQSLSFANGVATPLPQSLLTEYASESVLLDTADLTARYSWVPQFADFVHSSDLRLGYYCINEGTAYVVQPGSVYANGSGLTGSLSLTIPCVVDVPATATSTINCRDEIIDDIVLELADSLTPLTQRAKAL